MINVHKHFDAIAVSNIAMTTAPRGVRVRTNLKAGALTSNHSETLRVRTHVKAGGVRQNHNETFTKRRP